jgi:putative ABC transport system permease protein
MKYLTLIIAGLRRRPLRTALTMLAVAVAFLLFGVMHGLISSFDQISEAMSETRLRVLSRANILESLPIAYQDRILAVEGVSEAVPIAIFVAYYQSPINQISGAGMDIDGFARIMPEIRLSAEELDALRATRTGAVAGVLLAERFGWQIGDRIPMKSMLWMNEETGPDWAFDLVAIANDGPDDNRAFAQELWFHYAYLDEARASGKGRVNQFILGIDDAGSADRIAEEVDALFANSSDETTTLNEKQYIESNLRRIGNVEAFIYYILSAVLFTLLFMTATNMVQAIRERTTEIGIMRAMGFRGDGLGVLVIVESVLICGIGALLGLAIAGLLFPSVFTAFGVQGIQLAGSVYLQGLALAVGLAVVAAAWPAWRAGSLNVVDAIAGQHRR